jgi:hypothetical protein
MGAIRLSDIDKTSVSKIEAKVEDHSRVLTDIVNNIIEPYCKDLDRYVLFIKE